MIPLQGSTGALFTTLGRLGAVLKNCKSFQATQATSFTNALAQMVAEPDVQAILGAGYPSSLDNLGQAGSLIRQTAVAVLNRAVYRDAPRLNQTLTNYNTGASLVELFRQMRSSGDSVLAMTVGATAGSFVGTGNGALVASTKRASDGRVMENSFDETLTITVTGDSYTSTGTAGNEPYRITGEGSQTNLFAANWPLGSNANKTGKVIDGSANNTRGNYLYNSGWDVGSSNTPTRWVIENGAAGVQVFQNASIVYDGAESLQLVGDGSTLTALSQTFNSSSGTTNTLAPNTQYAWNLWMRRDGTAPTGQLVVELVDSGGVVIKDELLVDNSSTISLSGLTVNWAAYNGVFRTPTIMPSAYKIRLRMPTGQPLSNGRSIFLDKLALGLMTQAYSGGPSLATFGGSVPFEAGDTAQAVITNSRGAGGTLSTWQTLFSQLFTEMLQLELLIPSSATPTISDSLIA